MLAIATLVICNLHSPSALHVPEVQHDEHAVFGEAEHHHAAPDTADDLDYGTVMHDHHVPNGLTVPSSSLDHRVGEQKSAHLAEDPNALASLHVAPLTEPPAA